MVLKLAFGAYYDLDIIKVSCILIYVHYLSISNEYIKNTQNLVKATRYTR